LGQLQQSVNDNQVAKNEKAALNGPFFLALEEFRSF